jgi:HSP20 family protein
MRNLIPWRRKKKTETMPAETRREDLFGRFFDDPFALTTDFFSERSWFPRMDVSDRKSDILVEAEIPGMEKKDIDVRLNGRRLIISGERSWDREEKEQDYICCERSYGSFHRALELPADVDESKIEAVYKNGILKLVLPKTKESQTRSIDIKTP